MKDPGVFGDELDECNPSRWIEDRNDEDLQAMNERLGYVFGSGTSECLGKRLAFWNLQSLC